MTEKEALLWVLGILGSLCAAAITIDKVLDIIHKYIKKAQAPDDAQNKRLDELDKRIGTLEQGQLQHTQALARDLRRAGVPMQRLLTLENLTAVANELGYKDVPNLYVAIGEAHLGAQSVVEKLVQLHGGEEETVDTVTEDVVVRQRRRPVSDGAQILVDGDDSVVAKFAKCCYPLPGDEIIGFVTKTDGVSVHRADCSNVPALKKEPERIVPVSWADGEASATFVVTIQIEGLDRARLLSDVSSALSEQHLDILSVNISTNKHRQFTGKFTFESADPTHLQHVMNQVRRVPGVYDVFRISG